MIKLITSKDQLRVGAVIKVYEQNGTPFDTIFIVRTFGDTFIEATSGHTFCFPNDPELDGIKYFELVSMPERRKLTWEYVKKHIDELPRLMAWKNNSKVSIRYATKESFQDDLNSHNHLLYDSTYFIDPPLPEIPEVLEPWLVKEEAISTIDDYMNKKSLWWVKTSQSIFLCSTYGTKEILRSTGFLIDFIQPYNEASQFGPREHKWEEVK